MKLLQILGKVDTIEDRSFYLRVSEQKKRFKSMTYYACKLARILFYNYTDGYQLEDRLNIIQSIHLKLNQKYYF